jgi:competence protein ComEC
MWIVRWGLVAGAVAWLVGLIAASLMPVAALRVPLLLAGVVGLVLAVGITTLALRQTAPARWDVPMAALWLGVIVVLAMARFAWALPGNDPRNILHAGLGTVVEVRGSVSSEPDVRQKGAFITVAVAEFSPDRGRTWQAADGTVQVYALGAQSAFAPDYGDSVEFSGTLAAPPQTVPGIDAAMGAATVTVVAHGAGNPLLGAIYRLRAGLAQALEGALPAPEAALIIGILLGLKTPVLRARQPLFVRTGTIHLVVTSGLKVTLVGAIMARLARPLGRVAGMGLALGSVVGYVLLSGAGPAAIRAGIMGVILIVARFLGRDYEVLRALGLAVLVMTLVAPDIVWDVGFQLSAVGTLGIAILAPRLRAPLNRWWGRWRVGRVAADVLAATLAAQLATLPIVAITFGIISFVSLLANLLLVPFLPLFLLLGALVGFGGLVAAPLGALLGLVAWPILRLADLVIEVTAALPGAAITVGNIPGWLTPVWVIGIGCVPLLWRPPQPSVNGQLTAWPWQLRIGVGLAVVLALFTGAVGVAAAAPSSLTVTFLDVGTGGPATLVRLGNQRTVLIDGGADGTALLSALATTLPFWQRRIDLVVVTEMRPGHYLGLQSLLAAYQIGAVVDPGDLHPTVADAAWYTNLQTAHIPVTHISQGGTIQLAPTAQLAVLNPPRPLYDGTDEQDVNALVVRLVTPGVRILFAGDANDLALAQASMGQDVSADIVQLCLLPNEGLVPGTGWADLLHLALPRMVLIAPSARTPPKSGTLAAQPTPDDPAASPGMQVVHLSGAGTLTLTSDGTGWAMVA